jgi:hypothetical protein
MQLCSMTHNLWTAAARLRFSVNLKGYDAPNPIFLASFTA